MLRSKRFQDICSKSWIPEDNAFPYKGTFSFIFVVCQFLERLANFSQTKPRILPPFTTNVLYIVHVRLKYHQSGLKWKRFVKNYGEKIKNDPSEFYQDIYSNFTKIQFSYSRFLQRIYKISPTTFYFISHPVYSETLFRSFLLKCKQRNDNR